MRAGERLWAIGDVTGILQLTHVGEYQGEVVASNILGEPREAHYEAVPRVTYTDPQAAAVGATEAEFSATAQLSEIAKTADLHARVREVERVPDPAQRRRAPDRRLRARSGGRRVAAAGDARDPRQGPARGAARHDPAVPELLGDPRRGAESTPAARSRRQGAAAGCRLAMSPPVAIITGASQGIGAGLVAGYRSAGYAVVGVALSFPSADQDESDYVPVAGDIADAQTARRAVDEARDRFGRIDTLINNAGIYIGKPFTEYTFDEYEAITAVNLTGFFHITQLAIAEMVARGSGHVVNVSTSLVDNADSTRPSALPALTKGGLVAASRSLAIEYASRGVRVNAVSLGVIKTPAHDPASYDGLEALHPLGRVGEVSDVVDAILYLERATFVTGETLHVDGGQAAGR